VSQGSGILLVRVAQEVMELTDTDVAVPTDGAALDRLATDPAWSRELRCADAPLLVGLAAEAAGEWSRVPPGSGDSTVGSAGLSSGAGPPSSDPVVGSVGASSGARPAAGESAGGRAGVGEAAPSLPAIDEQLVASVGAISSVDLDGHGDADIVDHLERVQRQMNRLQAHRARCAGVLTRRAIQRAGRGRESRATRGVQEQLTDRLGLSPSEARQAGRAGRQRDASPETTKAHDAGDIRDEHARMINRALDQIPPAKRQAAERRLLKLARRQHPGEFGRSVRRLVERLSRDGADRSKRELHERRYGRMNQLPDGMTTFSSGVSGLDAETVQTAINAFRTPDATGERRTPEQATADAFVAMCQAALRAGEAPEQHGVPPQVAVVISLADLTSGLGSGEGAWTGPIPARDIQRLCHDATISRVLVDARSVPIEVSEGRRTVTSGVWKALVVRDRGCRWPGCDAPPAWCDVAHGERPHRHNGQLTLSNAVLLCRRHHRRVDGNGWTIKIRGPDITFVAGDGRKVESPPPSLE
jgi:hypothetical protein